MNPGITPGSSPRWISHWSRQAAPRQSGLLSPPHRNALSHRLFGARLDLRLGQGAERMIDHHWGEVAHAERIALHLRLVQKLGGDDDRGRSAQCFESDAVMRTARSA